MQQNPKANTLFVIVPSVAGTKTLATKRTLDLFERPSQGTHCMVANVFEGQPRLGYLLPFIEKPWARRLYMKRFSLTQAVQNIVEQTLAKLHSCPPGTQVVLVGRSLGCRVALELIRNRRMGNIIGLVCYSPALGLPDDAESFNPLKNIGIPIFLAGGDQDAEYKQAEAWGESVLSDSCLALSLPGCRHMYDEPKLGPKKNPAYSSKDTAATDRELMAWLELNKLLPAR